MRDTVGYSGIQRDTAGSIAGCSGSRIQPDAARYSWIYSGMQREQDTAGYSGIQRDTIKIYSRARVVYDRSLFFRVELGVALAA